MSTPAAAELTLSIVRASDSRAEITVLPNTLVEYEIRGLLSSDTDNEGLAFWAANLEFVSPASLANHTGGAVPAGMASFVRDAGFSNPGGYGGTPIAGTLVQMGGGQNTIANEAANAPYPVGEVTLGIAQTNYQVLATGSYHVPSSAQAGEVHELKLTACLASAIDLDATSAPFGTHAIRANCGAAVLSIRTPPAATVSAAVTRKANSSGPGGLCDLDLTPPVRSETRNTRITELRIGFDTAPGNPAGSGTGVSIEQRTCAAPTYVAYSGSATWTETASGNELILNFDPYLENARTYKISLGALVTATGGQSVEVRGLIGDVDDSGQVDATDRSILVAVWTGSGFSCKTDLNSDGVTNASDRSILINAWTGPEPCAP